LDHVTIIAEERNMNSPTDSSTEVVFQADAAKMPALDLLQRALALRATDIHVDPAEDDYRVRMRIDGLLEEYCRLGEDVAQHLIHQLKILADQDIADPFHVHEGRLKLPTDNWTCQARLTTSPVEGGEAVCLRLHSNEALMRSLDDLGASPANRQALDEMLRRGAGLILVTGPTGAGKTTTVYAMLRELELRQGHLNMVTIEDPVEIRAPFLRQLSVDEQHGLTIAKGLRTMLRMDPDVVFVGEIRDAETAETAMRAASSGKYVFSSLHTRDVASTVTALRDLGITDWSLSANLTGLVSQRLVRRLCQTCRRAQAVADADRQFFQDHGVEPPDQIYQAAGCDLCRNRGYLGRIGVFESIVNHGDLAAAIIAGASEEALRQQMRSGGTLGLVADGLLKVAAGITSLAEVKQMHWL
jgi:type II secretory ATPase GspE/PulE/Tfp pilus assembly ATPase PilB-like protein